MNEVDSLEAWIAKAEEDYRVALATMRQRKYPAHDAACFHCQQCAEKYLKGFLVRHKRTFRKTHDLRDLRRQCMQIDGTFDLLTNQLLTLNNYAVQFRYPGVTATLDEARDAVTAMIEIRRFVRRRLGLK